jgi:hypothetical protein
MRNIYLDIYRDILNLFHVERLPGYLPRFWFNLFSQKVAWIFTWILVQPFPKRLPGYLPEFWSNLFPKGCLDIYLGFLPILFPKGCLDICLDFGSTFSQKVAWIFA